MNLLETVLDYMLQTQVVVRALEHFRETSTRCRRSVSSWPATTSWDPYKD